MEVVTIIKKLGKGSQKLKGQVVYKHSQGLFEVVDLGRYRESFYPNEIIKREVLEL